MERVPEPNKVRNLVLVILVAIGILGVAGAFLEIPRSLRCEAVLDPASRWTLAELRPGSFQSVAEDLVAGRNLQYQVLQFDRPAFLTFQLSEGGPAGIGNVDCAVGQIVATVRSTSMDIEVAERMTSLREARARLEALRGGEKPETLEAAQLAVSQAETAMAAYLPHYARYEEMVASGNVSQAEWEEVIAHRDLLQLDLRLARAELRVLESGARPEDIAAAEVSAAALEAELAAVQAMQGAQEIRSPIAGRMRLGGYDDALLSVTRLDTMVVRILIPQHQAAAARTGQDLRIHVDGVHEVFRGRINRIDRRVTVTAGGSFMTAFGTVDNSDGLLDEGMLAVVRIHTGRSSPLGALWRDILKTVRREFFSA